MPVKASSSSPARPSRSRKVEAESPASSVAVKPESSPVTPAKRTRGSAKKEEPATSDAEVDVTPSKRRKGGAAAAAAKKEEDGEEAVEMVKTVKPSPSLAKKLKQLEMHRQTPFPSFARPSSTECKDVMEALASVHGMPARPLKLEDRPNAAAGCGQVPSVLDALVRTILSQNTTSKNSTAAKKSMDAMFGCVRSLFVRGYVEV